MKNTQNEEIIIDTFVKRCIDNIIKHKLIEKVTDLKSFANYALPLGVDDDMLFELIRQGTDITYIEELSDEERKELDDLAFRSLYDKEYPLGCVTIRPYGKDKLYEHFLIIVRDRILRLVKKINADIQRVICP